MMKRFIACAPIEIYIHNDFEGRDYWHRSRMEAIDGEYYVVGYKGSLEGMRARIRR